MFHFKICLALRYDAKLYFYFKTLSVFFGLLRETNAITAEIGAAFWYACFFLDQIILPFLEFHSLVWIGVELLHCYSFLLDAAAKAERSHILSLGYKYLSPWGIQDEEFPIRCWFWNWWEHDTHNDQWKTTNSLFQNVFTCFPQLGRTLLATGPWEKVTFWWKLIFCHFSLRPSIAHNLGYSN